MILFSSGKEDEEGHMLTHPPVRQTIADLSPVSAADTMATERHPNGVMRESLSTTPLVAETLAPSVSTV